MAAAFIGLDLAKSVFQVHGVDVQGKVVVTKRLRRDAVLAFFANLAPCVVGMEACAGSHFWAREIARLGHAVRLMAPQYVKPYVKRQKNDRADAEAICEAVARPSMRFVAVKRVLLQSSDGDKAAVSLGHSQAAISNSEFTKAAWATMSSPPIPFTCPFLIIAKAS
jgi:transposase